MSHPTLPDNIDALESWLKDTFVKPSLARELIAKINELKNVVKMAGGTITTIGIGSGQMVMGQSLQDIVLLSYTVSSGEQLQFGLRCNHAGRLVDWGLIDHQEPMAAPRVH